MAYKQRPRSQSSYTSNRSQLSKNSISNGLSYQQINDIISFKSDSKNQKNGYDVQKSTQQDWNQQFPFSDGTKTSFRPSVTGHSIQKKKRSNTVDPNAEEKSQRFRNKLHKTNTLNKEFFDHLKGQCKCGTCNCHKCRCYLRDLQQVYRPNIQTEYQQQISSEKELDTADFFHIDYEPFRSDTQMELMSTNKQDFVEKTGIDPKLEQVMINRDNLICGEQKIDHNTFYNTQFNTKTVPKNIKFKQLEQSYVPHSLAMQLKTESQKLAGEQPQSKSKPINFAYERDKKLHPPIAVCMPVENQTAYRTSHQNWFINKYGSENKPLSRTQQSSFQDLTNYQGVQNKTRPQNQLSYDKNTFRIKNTRVEDQIPVYDSHFRTTMQSDFTEKPYQACKNLNSYQQKPIFDNVNKLGRRSYMYRQYSETQGKFT